METKYGSDESSEKISNHYTIIFFTVAGLGIAILAGAVGFMAGVNTKHSVSPQPSPTLVEPWAQVQHMPLVTLLPPNARPGALSQAAPEASPISEQTVLQTTLTPTPDVYTDIEWRQYTSQPLDVSLLYPYYPQEPIDRQIHERTDHNGGAIWVSFTASGDLMDIFEYISKSKLLAAGYDEPTTPPQTTFHGYPAVFYPAFEQPFPSSSMDQYVVKVSSTAYYVISANLPVHGVAGTDYDYVTRVTQKMLDSLIFLINK